MWRTGSRRVSFSSCGWRAQECGLHVAVGGPHVAVGGPHVAVGGLHMVVAQGFSCPHGMWDPPGFKDQTCVPCIGRQILNH